MRQRSYVHTRELESSLFSNGRHAKRMGVSAKHTSFIGSSLGQLSRIQRDWLDFVRQRHISLCIYSRKDNLRKVEHLLGQLKYV